MLLDEGEIQHRLSPRANGRFVRFENKLHHALQRRDVAADADLAIFAGDPGRAESRHLDRVLRRGEPLERAFTQRVHGHDRNAAPRRLAQRGHHPRAVGAGILPNHEDRVGLLEILQHDRALADANAFGQADAGRLVAHVGAVGKVVGAKASHEDLVEKRGFVRSAARRIEIRPVGALQRAQMRPDQVKRVLPTDRLIVVGRAVVAHRLRQATLFLQPVIALPFQFADGVGREELRVSPFAS